MSMKNNGKSRHPDTVRTAFIIGYLEALKSKRIRFAIIRGYREMFANQDKDIDFLMNPSDYRMAISCYKNLLKKFEGAFISSSVSNKNLYLKSLFVNDTGDGIEFQGLYVHITAYVTIKTSYAERDARYVGKKIWIDSFESVDDEIGGVLVPVPNPKIQVLILLSRYAQKNRQRDILEIQKIIADNLLQKWIGAVDRYGYLGAASSGYASCKSSANLFALIDDLVTLLGVDRSSGKLSEYVALIGANAKGCFQNNNRLIFFSGPDGSGKTTANEALTKVLSDKLKMRVFNSKHLYPLSNRLGKQGARVQARLRKIDPNDLEVLERDRGHTFLWRTRRRAGLWYLLIQMYPGYFYARWGNGRKRLIELF